MTDLINIAVSRASSSDRDEVTTDGFCIDVQIGPFVFNFTVTVRPFWRRKK